MSESSTEQPRVVVPEETEAEVPAEPETEALAADVDTSSEDAPAEDQPEEASVEASAAEDQPPAAETAAEPAEAEPESAEPPAAEAKPTEAEPSKEAAQPAETKAETEPSKPEPEKKKRTPGAPTSFVASMAPAVMALKELMDSKTKVTGKVIGWNKGGFHVVCEGVTAFCPNSEMESGKVKAPKDYLDQSYEFSVLRIEDNGRRVVLSRGEPGAAGKQSADVEQAQPQAEPTRPTPRQKIEAGAEIEGKVASLTNFGAFVDVGGVQGLVHVSEISRSRVEDPAQVLSVGQRVKVKVLKVEQGGKRISLSMKALAPDPWKGVAERFPEGSVVQGTVERTAKFGAFIALEPGLTGLLPASVLNLPRDASINRMYHPGKQLSVMVMSVDPRRRRISLALEGSQSEGSRSDFESYKKSQQVDAETGFNALAAAFQKVQKQG